MPGIFNAITARCAEPGLLTRPELHLLSDFRFSYCPSVQTIFTIREQKNHKKSGQINRNMHGSSFSFQKTLIFNMIFLVMGSFFRGIVFAFTHI